MKKLISIIIISLSFLPLVAQNDYYIKQAQSYQREAEYYTKQALVRIPVDTRSPIPVISVQSVGDLQYRWQS